MKIAITGHTSGIGKAIYKHFSVSETVKGFSLSNGYDICKDGKRIIDATNDCDIFINNACHGWCQVNLLYELLPTWQDTNKLIINIGSLAEPKKNPYKRTIQKAALNLTTEQLQFDVKTKCRITTIKLGYVDTPLLTIADINKLDPSDVVQTVEWILQQPPSMEILEISMRIKEK